ncbi:hypothetical protein TcYC6_0077140 [Trypanosoma cruzi]|nr:hypothetical protein TcYC6_0077140 [Trypanosoma cruzi]
MSTNPEEREAEPQPSPHSVPPQQQLQEEANVEEMTGVGAADAAVEEVAFVPPLPQQKEEQQQAEEQQLEVAPQEEQRDEERGMQGIVEVEGNIDTKLRTLLGAHPTPHSRKGGSTTKEGDAESLSTATETRFQMSKTLPPLTALSLLEKGIGSEFRARDASNRSFKMGSYDSSTGNRFYSAGNYAPFRTVNSMTPNEEYMAFRARNGVSSYYKGPIFAVEDLYVMCAECGAPVDPVTRVPAGKLFFHPQCISCKLCGRTDIADAYFRAMGNGAICSECASRGFAWCVPREAAAARGIIPGAVVGKIDEAVRLYDLKRNLQPINHPTLPGAIPPTLVLGRLFVHRGQSTRKYSLIQRQQYYTQNDNNIICLPPEGSRAYSRASSASRHRWKKDEMPKLM